MKIHRHQHLSSGEARIIQSAFVCVCVCVCYPNFPESRYYFHNWKKELRKRIRKVYLKLGCPTIRK